ncbi:AAA family ATPase [Sphingomonas sp. 2R-10]|uniref:AAA family ATPase n=1 Tax=Sphingomonas sp. 2R-10 TaxID=3045148 RepID=UPI000F773769|nr:AAA family ATPase [Sphingomonas sp. 2R-10]MDJ0275187.1 AAA family ATPase [Sphingomonas sp. 2R-10]
MARLTGITLRNFKAVGDVPIHIDLAPVTLLYGPNGAGKSSILHALHYAREVLERGNLDPDRTLAGGTLDLGGWRALVHQRDAGRDMVLGFDLALDDLGANFNVAYNDMGPAIDPERLQAPDFADEASVELTIRWSQPRAAPYVARLAVSAWSAPFAALEASADGRSVELTDLNADHPLLNDPDWSAQESEWPDAPDGHIQTLLFPRRTSDGETIARIGVLNTVDALPPAAGFVVDWDDHPVAPPDSFPRAFPRSYRGEIVPGSEERGFVYSADMGRREQLAVDEYLNAVMTGAVNALRETLASMVAIGPLRELPPRNFSAQRSPDPTRWANGLAAWDRLATLDEDTVAEVDAWMSGVTRLGSGFGLRVERFRRVAMANPFAELMARGLTPLDLGDLTRLWEDIPEERRITLRDVARRIDVEPAEIGVGVSQLLPVVVAALDRKAKFVAVEQPELHVHPRLQTGLGDLFAFGATPRAEPNDTEDIADQLFGTANRTFLIETHSEHLALRLLRRIREANEGETDPDAPTVTPTMLSINYALPGEAGLTLVRLRIDETGEFLDRWPQGFFAEREDELF